MNEPIRILAVDDEPDLRSLLRIILQGKGFQVEEASPVKRRSAWSPAARPTIWSLWIS